MLFNFLALLGWSPGEDREVMTKDEMISLFTLDRVKSNPAQFDLKKLEWMNGEYIRRMSPEAYLEIFKTEARAAGHDVDNACTTFLKELAAQMQIRTKLYSDIAPMIDYFFKDDYSFDEKAVAKRLMKDDVPQLLMDTANLLEAVEPFDLATVEAKVRAFIETRGQTFGVLVHPVRVAVSGRGEGPGFFELLVLLGKKRSVERLRDVAARITEKRF